MYVYQSTNPCICGGPSVVVDPGCPDECNCLHLCNITINRNSELAIETCGDTTSIPLLSEEYNHDTCACGEDELVLTVEYFDEDIFQSASIDIDDNLDLISVATDNPNQYSEVVIKGSCGLIAMYFTVLVGINSPECDPECGENEECVCGECQAIVPDVILT